MHLEAVKTETYVQVIDSTFRSHLPRARLAGLRRMLRRICLRMELIPEKADANLQITPQMLKTRSMS